MLVVFEKETGRVVMMSITSRMNDKKEKIEPTLKEVAPELDTELYTSVVFPDNEETALDYFKYKVVASEEGDFVLEYIPEKVIVLEDSLNKVDIGDGKIVRTLKCSTESVLKVRFMDTMGGTYKPEGLLRLTNTRGILSDKFINLDGTISEVSVTYTAPSETVPVKIKCYLKGYASAKVKMEVVS